MGTATPADGADGAKTTPREDAIARFALGTVVWALTATVVFDALVVAVDCALVVKSGAAWRVVLASGIAGASLSTFVAVALGPAAAALELVCQRIARSRARALWVLPIVVTAWLFGAAMTSMFFQPTKVVELGVVTGFAVVVVVCAVLARARRAWPLSLALAAIAIYLGVRAPIVRRDWLDLLAVASVCALLAAAWRLKRRIAQAPKGHLFAVLGALLVVSVAAAKSLDLAPLHWRAAAVHHAQYEPRLARVCRAAIDLDGDGFSAIAWGGDCDDADPRRNPRAHELPNGIDGNCNGTVRPARPTDAERGLAPAAGDPNAPAGAIDLMVLVTVDAWRVDSLRLDVMPNATAFAARAVNMSRAYSAGTATRVAMRLALRVGADEESVASRLELAGVSTHAVFGFNRPELRATFLDGFKDVPIPRGERWDARETTDIALAMLAQAHTGSRFLWVHYYDAHTPLIQVTSGVAPTYLAELAFIDREMGRLLAAIDPARSIIVVTADHGELFDSYGAGYHAVSAKEAVVRVPAMFTAPGLAPATYDGLISTRDVAPTILGALGRCDAAAERFGRSWLRLRDAPEARLHDFVVSYSAEAVRGMTYLMPLAAIVEPRLKLIETFENTLVEVYDPAADPLEVVDLATSDTAEIAALRRRLAIYRDIDGYL